MKLFIVTALALVAVAAANEEGFKKRVGDFEANRAEKREKWNALTDEERQKIREEHANKMPHRPVHHLKDIPDEVRQKIKEKFESLTPEERQKMHERFQHQFVDGARPYGVENVEKFKKHFEGMPEEKKQLIREKFEKLTPEQRNEIRNLKDRHQKIPAIVGPSPAAANGDYQRIRTREEDIMINDRIVRDSKNDRRNPRFPAAIDGQEQQIRTREDREKWTNELRAEKKKHNSA